MGRRLTMTTNIEGAILTPESLRTIKFLQQENYVEEYIKQIDEIIDIVVDENTHEVLTSDKECLRIVRNLRYLVQHLSSFKIPNNHE